MMRCISCVALVALVVLDGMWLGVVMKDFYRRSLAPSRGWPTAAWIRSGQSPRWSIPCSRSASRCSCCRARATPFEALALGALFGAMTFAVYDLTNHATLREWRPAMTMIDIAWGACSCGVASWVRPRSRDAREPASDADAIGAALSDPRGGADDRPQRRHAAGVGTPL